MNSTKTTIANAFKNNKWLHIFLLALLPAILYIQSVKFDYTNFDDNGIIQQRFYFVGNIHKIDSVFKVDAFFNPKGDFYRPVQNISFMLDAQVSRDNLWMFHTTNLIIHILTCIALYFFLQILKLQRLVAFLLALLFAAHPLFASGVGWIPSRGDILIGLLGILLFITFDQYFKKNKALWFTLHSLVFLVILFTKETTILFPILLVYYYFFVIQHLSDFKFKKGVITLSPFFILWLAVCLVFLFCRSKVTSNTGATMDVLGIIPFFKNNTVIPTIIGKFFVPIRLSSFPLYDNTSTIIGLVFLLVLLFITFEYTREKKWAALMGLLWFAIFAIPPTIYRLENADVFFNYLEHRTYLPMIGIVIILGFFLNEMFKHKTFTKYFPWVYVPVIILFSVQAFIHCADYKNSFTIRQRAADLDNPSALAGVAGELLLKGDTTLALEKINQVIKLNPNDATMYFELGKIMSRSQQHEQAEQNFSLALEIQPHAIDALMARSIERRYLKKYESAFRDIFLAASLDSTNPKVYYSFGNLFIATKDYGNAITAFSRCISFQPKFGEAYNNRAYAKTALGDYEGALRDCDSAIAIIPKNPVVYNNKGMAYRELNKFDSAFTYFNKAIALNVNFADGYFERGKAWQKKNEMDSACKDWKMATGLGYSDTAKLAEKYCRLNYIQ